MGDLMLVGGGRVAPIGVLWREPGHGPWHFRQSLGGRTYPPGAEYMHVYATASDQLHPRLIPEWPCD
jgi:hypothetical protein